MYVSSSLQKIISADPSFLTSQTLLLRMMILMIETLRWDLVLLVRDARTQIAHPYLISDSQSNYGCDCQLRVVMMRRYDLQAASAFSMSRDTRVCPGD